MRRSFLQVTWLLLGVAPLAAAPLGAQVTLGQIDTFEDGTTENWFVGAGPVAGVHPAPPTNVATGGPQGADDNYLLLTALGSGMEASRLAALNATQWAGDYRAAGITSIQGWFNNFGPDDLFLRLVFEDPIPGPPMNVAFSADAVFLPAGSGWTRLGFPIFDAALLAGLGTVDAAMTGTRVFRIYHSPEPNFPNPVFPIAQVNARLGVDDLRATAVPEPLTVVLLGIGLAGVGAAGIRRRT